MLKYKLHFMAALLLVSLSACGIFKKGCDCPKVSYKGVKHSYVINA